MKEYTYDMDVLETFLNEQGKLFPESVADTPEEADAFLEEVFAVVADSEKEVIEYFEEEGIDFDTDDILEAAEVFPLKGGRYLIVEG